MELPPPPPPPAEKEKTPAAEADFDTGGGAKVLAEFVEPPAPNTPLSFLAPDPEKLNVVGPGPGSVLDFPKEKRLAGLSLGLLTALLFVLKEKEAAVVVAVAAEPPKLNEGAGALKEAALVT